MKSVFIARVMATTKNISCSWESEVFFHILSEQISRHQTCFEKCLEKNKEGDFTDLKARILRINPPHLTPTFKRRKRSVEGKQIEYTPLIQNSCNQNVVQGITIKSILRSI